MTKKKIISFTDEPLQQIDCSAKITLIQAFFISVMKI